MLKGLLFDFDGLLIDTEYTWYPIYRDYFMTYHNYKMVMDDFLTCIGADDTHFMTIIRDAIGDSFNQHHFDEYRWPLFLEQSAKLPMMSGALTLLQEAHQQGLKLAIATSSKHPHAQVHLKRWGIENLFDAIVTADDVQRIKPAPDLFLKAVDALGLQAKDVFIFEDSYNGLVAANKAGIDCIIVPNEVTKNSSFETERLRLDHLGQITIKRLKELKHENY